MNRKLVFLTILFILFFTFDKIALAQILEVGIEVGNIFVYDVSESIYGRRNNWTIVVFINSITGSLIDVSELMVFENGTEDSRYHNTYEVSMFSSNPYFFFENLNVNDQVYASEEGTIRVNKTISRSYASGNRETNYIIYNDLEAADLTVETYFDKQTGVLVESIEKHPPTGYEIQAKLKETNIWIVTDTPSSSPTVTPSRSQTPTESPSPTHNVPTPPPSASVTPTPESKPGIFLTFEILYLMIAIIIAVAAVAVVTIVLKRRKQ